MTAGARTISAGSMAARVGFERRSSTAGDGAGNYGGDFFEFYRCAARITPKMGGEEVTAARLQGIQPVIIRLRSCMAARTITPQDRAHDLRGDVYYNIKSISNPDERNIWIEMMCEAGKPT
jgi:head-tail adaptor